ncbi:MAG TPA: hypothetical protein VEU94_14140, partial [Terriglobales bacterium]|nr:hypothetical protein [Terriglobales bacterium]
APFSLTHHDPPDSLVLSLQLKNRYPRGFSAYPAASQPAVFALSGYPVYLVASRLTRFSLGLRMKLLLAVLALISAGPVAADCPKAADWARAFYSEHYSFYADPSDRVLQFTTPEFGALLKREWEYSKGEIGHLDYDPWLGGQDGEIGKPVRFSVETESPDTAIVSMSYPFVIDSKHPPERHTVHLVLRKREHECWQLQDFITPRGDSLSYVYSLPQP